jgi:predicted ATPase
LENEIHAGLREQFAFLADASLDAAQRRHFRVKPRTPETTIRTANGIVYPAYVIDFSISGASIETEAPVGVGEIIDFARLTRAKIVRSIGARGFGVEFQRQFRPHEFSWNIRL